MDDIAALMPQNEPTVDAIYEAYRRRGDGEARRGYLGASQIGHPCARHLWYSFRWCGRERMEGRMLRLLARGDVEEGRMVEDLRDIGCEVHDRDPNTGRQFSVSAVGGHFSGHMDGCALGIPKAPKTWHVLEFKTHNAKSFAFLKARGVRIAKPMHHVQMMVYMHLSGMTRALYLACNKDTDELYAERVRYDRAEGERWITRAQRIVEATSPPHDDAAGGDGVPADYCRFCPYGSLCRPAGEIVCGINCRTCALARPEMDGDGRWSCQVKQKTLSPNDQQAGCSWHTLLPGIIPFATPGEVGRNPDGSPWIEYRNADGTAWRNGGAKDLGQYASVELVRLPAGDVGAGNVDAVKKVFGAEVLEVMS